MREISELPEDLGKLLLAAGSRKLVLVEGSSDRKIFDSWYREAKDRILFHAPEIPEGKAGVRKRIDTFTAFNRRVFGIIDRDFCSDEEVEATLQAPDARLFILRWYAIENYLLVPVALCEFLTNLGDAKAVDEIEQELRSLCTRLHTMMAANWVCSEVAQKVKTETDRQLRFFSEGHDLIERKAVLMALAKRLNCDEEEAGQQLSAKENAILPLLVSLDSAYMRINGKHLLHHFHKHFISGITRERFYMLVAAEVRRNGLHSDIKTIVEERILA